MAIDRAESGYLGLVTGAALTLAVASLTGETHEKLEILPKCEEVRAASEALVPVPEDKVTQSIGKTAVCKIDDQVFRLVVKAQ